MDDPHSFPAIVRDAGMPIEILIVFWNMCINLSFHVLTKY